MCLRLRSTPWWIFWSVIETGTITFRGARTSHSEIHTSSRWNTNFAQESSRCSLRHAIIVSKMIAESQVAGFPEPDFSSPITRVYVGIRKNRPTPV
jgi:hypothetical protein